MVDGRGADTTIPYTAGEGYTKALALDVVGLSFLRFLERATANKISEIHQATRLTFRQQYQLM